jgi:hypothetical protein
MFITLSAKCRQSFDIVLADQWDDYPGEISEVSGLVQEDRGLN